MQWPGHGTWIKSSIRLTRPHTSIDFIIAPASILISFVKMLVFISVTYHANMSCYITNHKQKLKHFFKAYLAESRSSATP